MQTEQIRYGTFGPIVWDTETHETRFADQWALDSLPMGLDLTSDEEAALED